MDGDPTIHNALKHGCERFRFTMPRPKVYRMCREGFEDAVRTTCHGHCTSGTGHSASHAETNGAQFCKKYRKEMPKPGAFNACMAGVKAGNIAAGTFASSHKKEYDEKIAAGESDAEATQEMETEAKYEEALAHSTPEDRDVEDSAAQAKAAAAKAAASAAARKAADAAKAKTDLEQAREAAKAAFAAQQESAEGAAEGGLEEIDL